MSEREIQANMTSCPQGHTKAIHVFCCFQNNKRAFQFGQIQCSPITNMPMQFLNPNNPYNKSNSSKKHKNALPTGTRDPPMKTRAPPRMTMSAAERSFSEIRGKIVTKSSMVSNCHVCLFNCLAFRVQIATKVTLITLLH